MRIAAFPKCYVDDLCSGRMSLFEWIEMAASVGDEGLEQYDGFLANFDHAYLDTVREALHRHGFVMPMMCYSPDFTHPDPDRRKQEIEGEVKMIEVTAYLGGRFCRILSGQRHPETPLEQGIEWVIEAIEACLPVASEYDIVLAMENHYKDGRWQYPEFAQKREVFLTIIDRITERQHFGVQYDPSNAIVAGDDPIALLELVKDRVVTMHASDRYLKPGTRLEDLRQADGTLGYSPNLCHGEIGKGLNDYDRIFSILWKAGFDGWVSIEDGMNSIDEIRRSADFLKRMRQKYWGQ
jgi:sugar phosphate isomerase/epimerase